MEKIRIYKGNVETEFGVSFALVCDDPVSPKYTREAVTECLMKALNYEPVSEDDDNDDDDTYPGHCDDTGAYFEYEGFEDVIIPESIVQRIKNS